MPFKKGDPRPANAGMKKDQVTMKNIVAREFLKGENCPLSNAVKILTESAELSDKERLDGWVKLIEYVASKMKSIEHSGPGGTDVFAQLLSRLNGPNS